MDTRYDDGPARPARPASTDHSRQPPGPAAPTPPSWRGPSRRTIAALAALVVLVSGAVAVLERMTRPPFSAPAPSASWPGGAASFGPYPAFAPDSVFQADVSTAPIHPRSAAMTALLARNVADNWGGIAPLNTAKYGAGFAVAEPDTPKVDVRFVDCQKKGGTPPGLYDGPAYFRSVPIPADAVPAPGSDGHLAVFDPGADRLWEFWIAAKDQRGRWQACWGGRIDDVSRANGQFPAPYGVGAAGLATVGYMVRLAEAKAARIDHAMGLVVMEAAPGHSYPANRDDGISSNPAALQEGLRLRLDPSVDVGALPMNSLGKAVARAAQRYGFIVCDKGGAVAVMAETGGRWEQRTGTNPWESLGYGGEAYQALRGFPWEKVQVIAKDWGKPNR